jgi:hypothetical protein
MNQTTQQLVSHVTIRLSSEQAEWVNNQAVSRSEYLRQLIDADMAKHQSKPQDQQGAR